jgi:hypothetical protein
MFDRRNAPMIRAAYVLDPQASCPVAAGDVGEWLDSTDSLVKRRNADGTDTVLSQGGSTLPAFLAKAATTAALAGSPVYDNGTAGVGATLTRGTNGALAAQDGVTLAAGDVLLVKDQAAAEQNGLYVVTVLGAAGAKYVLTRIAQFCEAATMLDGTIVMVQQGTVAADLNYRLTGTVTTVGTTAATFVLQPVTQLKIATFRSVGAAAPGAVFTGLNGAGAVTLTGAKVGDKVVLLVNLTDATDGSGSFEATVTVADQLQQSSGSNLSAKKFAVLLLSQS